MTAADLTPTTTLPKALTAAVDAARRTPGAYVDDRVRFAVCCCTDGRHGHTYRDTPGGNLAELRQYAAELSAKTDATWHPIAAEHVSIDTPWRVAS